MKRKFPTTEHFGRKLSHIFNDKGGMSSKITLVERDKIIHKDKEIAKTMKETKLYIKIKRLPKL